MQTSYGRLIHSSFYFFCFSILGIFFSAPGQTFLISLAIPTICSVVNITELMFAGIYSSATLIASFCLPLIGKKIDAWPAKKSLVFNAIFFGSSLFLFAVSYNATLLFISLFFMRLFGQGALTLTATSHTIKRFNQDRGAALSLTQLGYPLSEFVFPSVFLFLFNLLGLSSTYALFGLSIFLLYLPLTYGGISIDATTPKPAKPSQKKSVSVRLALKDPFFPIYVLLSSVPPIMMTAAFYFQVDIFTHQGWDIDQIALAIFSYALFKLLATLLVGPLIDKIGIVTPLMLLTLFIGIATVCIGIKGPVLIGLLYYSLYGIGIGASASTMNYLWALLYGSDYIAQIKGVIAIIRNGGTAISPILFSYFIYGANISFKTLFIYAGAFIVLMSLIPILMRYLDSRLRSSL